LSRYTSTRSFAALGEAGIPIIYSPTNAFPYKVGLKHENWKNVEKLLKSAAKFSKMSAYPVMLHQNLFNSQRHLLRFGTSKTKAKSKIIHEPTEIIGTKNIGKIKQRFRASLGVWSKDLISLAAIPTMVVADGRVIHEWV